MPVAPPIMRGSCSWQPRASLYVLPNLQACACGHYSPLPIAVMRQALNIPLRTFVHTRALLIALTYVSSSLAPAGTQTSFFGLLTINAKFLPYVLVAMDLLMGGPSAAAVSISGAVVGHLWWWGVWHTGALRGWGSAPSWLRSLMGQHGGVAGAVNIGGVHVIPPRREAARAPGGATWRGPGRRLGD